VNIPGHAVRRATLADAATIQALFATDPHYWQHVEGAPLRDDEARHILEERPPGTPPSQKHVFLVDGADALLDFCEGYPEPTTWFLGLIFLAPHVRNRGLGSRLIAALCDHVRAHGGTALRLAVATAHPDARRLYERLGFQFVDHRDRTIHTGAVVELAVMQLALTASRT
jgi:GNAT superfamily N-acetyltransferase